VTVHREYKVRRENQQDATNFVVRTRSYSSDDGHNDARNMLRNRFNNKQRN